MALARIARWLCGGASDDDDAKALETRSTIKVEGPKKPIETKSTIDVNVNAPKDVKVTHGVDLSGLNPFPALGRAVSHAGASVARIVTRDAGKVETGDNTTKASAVTGMRKQTGI